MVACHNRGGLHAKGENHADVYYCGPMVACTLVPTDRLFSDGKPIPCCSENCPSYKGPRISDTFDRVVIINLERRPDRLEQIKAELANQKWPFVEPIVMKAIDGKKVSCPDGYTEGNHVWACFQSHRRAIEDAINDDCHSVLVLEDDAILCDDFASRATQFMKDIPDDWEFAWLGVHHMQTPIPVKHGVVKTVQVDGCHAYAARGQGLNDLYRYWHRWHTGTTAHCDWAVAHWMGGRISYAADPQLIGQRGGYSDVAWREKPTWFVSPWNPVGSGSQQISELEKKTKFNLEEFPCRWRGRLKRECPATDGLVESPCYECGSPREFNQLKEASLWQYGNSQAIPFCNRCSFRELPFKD